MNLTDGGFRQWSDQDVLVENSRGDSDTWHGGLIDVAMLHIGLQKLVRWYPLNERNVMAF